MPKALAYLFSVLSTSLSLLLSILLLFLTSNQSIPRIGRSYSRLEASLRSITQRWNGDYYHNFSLRIQREKNNLIKSLGCLCHIKWNTDNKEHVSFFPVNAWMICVWQNERNLCLPGLKLPKCLRKIVKANSWIRLCIESLHAKYIGNFCLL